MDKERLVRIGKFLNDRLIIHRNVENNTPWTTEEKMIQELYDNYLELLIKHKKQQEVIDKAMSILKDNFVYDYVRSCDTTDGVGYDEIDTEHFTYIIYEILKEVSE